MDEADRKIRLNVSFAATAMKTEACQVFFGLWARRTSCIIDIHITDLDAGQNR
jgi:hypothetical protein